MFTIEMLIEKSTAGELIPMTDLIALAGDPLARGDDVRAAFVSQAQLRHAQAGEIRASKDDADLLASERRKATALDREIDHVMAMTDRIAARTQAAYQVPASQAVTQRTDDALPAVLTREHTMRDWLQRRGNYTYSDAREPLRFGAIVRALAGGSRAGLSGLEQRVLSEGTDGSGGYTVPEILAASFIDRVRNAMVTARAGAQIVPMTSDVLHIARLGQPVGVSPTINPPTWKSENATITENDAILERVTFTARTLPMLIRMSVELQEDSNNIDAIIEREMSQAMAIELDRAALLGSGTAPVPRGIRNQSGVGVTAFGGSAPANYDFIVNAIGRIWAANHEPNAWIVNASLATLVAKFKESANGQPLRAPEAVTALSAFRTNQIPDDGVSPETSSLFVGDFRELMIGMRTSFRIEVTRTGGTETFERLQVAVRAYLRADVQLAHAAAFDVTTGVGV